MAQNRHVVIFVSRRTADDADGYAAMAAEMSRLAEAQPGFVSMQSVRGTDGTGITLCYWESEEAIAAWKDHVDHAAAQQLGMQRWYTAYSVTIAKVTRHYGTASQ